MNHNDISRPISISCRSSNTGSQTSDVITNATAEVTSICTHLENHFSLLLERSNFVKPLCIELKKGSVRGERDVCTGCCVDLFLS